MASDIQLQFRVATPGDAVQIAQLVQTAFRADDSRAGWTADVELNRGFSMTPEEVRSTIDNPNAAFMMATTDDGKLVGVTGVVQRSEDLAHLAHLAVDQTYQRGGLGRRILEGAEEYARKTLGIERLGLNALNTRKLLIEWYERRGYVKTGETLPFPLEAYKDLYFVEMEKKLEKKEGV